MKPIYRYAFQLIITIQFCLITGPCNAETKYDLVEQGNAFIEGKQYDIAIRLYDKAIEDDSDFAVAYINRGIAYMEIGKMDKAIIDFNKAIEIDSNDSDAFFNRGRARWKTGDFDGALADLTKVIRMHPEDYEAYANRAVVFESKSKSDRELALSDYSKALEINPAYSEGYWRRAGLWRSEGKYDHAIADYDMAIKTDSKNYRAYGNKAHLLATCPDSNYRDGEEAVRLANKALELDHGSTSLGILAAAYAETGDFRKATELQNQAISLLAQEKGWKKESEFRQQLESYRAHKPWRD